MNIIFNKLKDTINKQANINLNSLSLPFYCSTNASVAIVHNKSRMSQDEREFFEKNNLLDNQGNTKECYNLDTIKMLQNSVPNAVKVVSAIYYEKKSDIWCYNPKYPKDKWKKLQDNCNILATIEHTTFNNETPKEAETILRDTIRSAKEIPSLKPHPFIWIAQAPKEIDLEEFCKHYFEDYKLTFSKNNTQIAIAYHSNLGKLNMRKFIYPPV